MTETDTGPLYYLWDGPKWRDFYYQIADEAPVDHIILGETVCSKTGSNFIEPYLEKWWNAWNGRERKSVAFPRWRSSPWSEKVGSLKS